MQFPYKLFLFFFVNWAVAQSLTSFDVARKGNLADIISLYNTDKNSLDAIDELGSSMLILACYRGNTDVAHFLIDHQANLNYISPNGTALMACVVKNQFELAKKILEKGANLNIQDGNGMTALMMAVQFKNSSIVKLLVDYKADKELKCKHNKTAFEYAVFSNYEEIITILK